MVEYKQSGKYFYKICKNGKKRVSIKEFIHKGGVMNEYIPEEYGYNLCPKTNGVYNHWLNKTRTPRTKILNYIKDIKLGDIIINNWGL